MPITIPVESNWSSNNFSQFTSSLSLSLISSSLPPLRTITRDHPPFPGRTSCLDGIIGFRDSGRDTGGRARIYERCGWFIRWQIASITRPCCIDDHQSGPRSLVSEHPFNYRIYLRRRNIIGCRDWWRGEKGRDYFFPLWARIYPCSRCIFARVIYNFIVTEPRVINDLPTREGGIFLAIFIQSAL